MKKSIYREVTLKKLSSPEQLDQLIRLTSPRAWLALAAIGLIIAALIIWGFVGSIPTKLEGKGILLNNAGVYSLNSESTGQITDLRFENGDMVKRGDVIARVEQSELVERINNMLDEDSQSQSSIEELQEELLYRSRIISPISGRIIGLNIQEGSVINKGQVLATFEEFSSTVRLEAVIYVSAEQGGKIKPGMEAQVIPSIVNKEEYGFMLGRVVSVSEYPATSQGMLSTLGSEELVTMLMGEGIPVQVKIDLTPDEETVSGYKWSSHSGPSLAIPSGTLVQGAVIINRERPIAKVIPFFDRKED
jgi:multidrug efflux pump subunit AcrA (membrane-fusion protein)